MALRLLRLSSSLRVISQVRYTSGSGVGEFGSGAGKGGGSGGSIRDAGGAFGKMEAAREEEYFKRKQKEQLNLLRSTLRSEIDFLKDQVKEHEEKQQLEVLREHHEQELRHHSEMISQHKEAIERHKKKIGQLKNLAKKEYDDD